MKLRMLVLPAILLCGCTTDQPKIAPGKTPQDAAAINAQLAVEYMKLDKLSTARMFIERALEQNPHSAEVQSTAGLVYERLGDMDKADKAFATSISLGKDDPNIQNNYAVYLCRNHRAAAGEKIFMQVVHNPVYRTPEVAYVNAGVCLRGTDDAAAERDFQQALLIKPNMPAALLELGSLQFDRGDTAQSLATVQRYLAVNQPSADILWLGFRAERKLGDDTAAAGYARRIQTEFPNSEQARLMQSGVFR